MAVAVAIPVRKLAQGVAHRIRGIQATAGEASTGLGLSMVKRLVDEEGGSVRLVSGPGEGAVFRISFPLAMG